jgi:hypothetical protein
VGYEVMSPYGGIPRETFRPVRAREAAALLGETARNMG